MEFIGSMEAPPSPEKEVEELDMMDLTDIDLDFRERESFTDELAELEVRFAGAAVGLPKLLRGVDGEMMELVHHELIRRLMKSPPISTPAPDYSAEAIGHTGITDEDLEIVIRGFRALETKLEIEHDIILQYRGKGYAYIDLPDDDPENY